MLFKYSDNLFVDNPELKFIPELSGLTESQIKFIIIVADYGSPYRRMPAIERRKRAATMAGYVTPGGHGELNKEGKSLLDGKVKEVEDAIKKYKEIQGWSELELLEGIDSQLEQFKTLMKKKTKSDKETEIVLKVMKELPKILENRKEILEMVEVVSEEEKAEDNKQDVAMSTLDECNLEDDSKE